jgi:DNA modification methylase
LDTSRDHGAANRPAIECAPHTSKRTSLRPARTASPTPIDASGGSLPVSSSIAEVAVARLHTWERNPRRISPSRLEDLQQALVADPAMLWARPLIVLPDGTVVCGNQRLRAAVELGWETMPALVVDLDPERARVWALRDNVAYGEWDEPALSGLLGELAAGGLDLALTGFETTDLDRLLDDLRRQVDPDEAPPLPATPQSVPAELYELGAHRLICGDATDPELLNRLLGRERAEVLWTDPPYGVDYVGKTREALRIRSDHRDGLEQLLDAAFAAVDVVLAPSARFYVAAPAGPLGLTFREAVVTAGWQLHQSLVWVKQTAVLGHSDYQYRHEDILYGWKAGSGRPGRGRHRGSRWQGDNAQTSVFQIDRPTRSSEHPTMKPVALVEAMLRNSSRRGDVVVDPFAGSGSTLIACEQLGRRCFAVELDPRYCDVIRQRYETHHG